MSRSLAALVLTLALVATTLFGVSAGAAAAAGASDSISLRLLGSYNSGLGAASTETVAHDRGRLYITNAASNTLDIVDVSAPATPRLVRRVSLAPFGAGPNSVDVHDGLVAVAIEANPKTSPGTVAFFDRNGDAIDVVQVGALPDMLTFDRRGRHLLVANEGEPNSYGQPDSVDPEGSVSIIDVRALLRGPRGAARRQPSIVRTVDFRDFNVGGRRHGDLSADIRIFGPNASVAQDLEPEYITLAEDGDTAWVTLQENNAIAVIDVDNARVRRLAPLGFKDHNQPGAGLDASDRDDRINIRPWPVRGMYLPDAIAAFEVSGDTYLVTANEGDARDWPGFTEESRIGSLTLDPAAFPNGAELKQLNNLGRLNVSRVMGQGANGYTGLYAIGGRSVSIWRAGGSLAQVWDSGDQIEQITAQVYPRNFNADNTSNDFDNRSDNKGPEPEGVAVGTIDRRTYAFVGLERIGGLMVFDVSNPRAPTFVQYINNRDFSLTPPGPDSGAEVVRFVSAHDSPTRQALVLVANEISGTVSIYEAQTK